MNTDIEPAPAPWAIGDYVTIRIHDDGRRDRGTIISMDHDGTQWMATIENIIIRLGTETLPAADLLAWDHGCTRFDDYGVIAP
ncbi:hypothetical protein B4N89_13415 [Embleya scabrispora]|uniref:KOW domain-containing protein n=1 Tax=Embleya scabrispora TaxID=159449 RepID=A0A1T3NY89_9ACTN|nr:hypothetical protein [Embleya scabrispora]OPC81799.1 hypothetical protein B4N89_13415 [Embleya scabrispora]